MQNTLTKALASERAWAIDERAFRLLMASAEDVDSARLAEAAERLAAIERAQDEDEGDGPARAARVEVQSGVAIIPITGPISATDTLWSLLFGGTSIARLRRQFRAALADDAVQAILLHVNSPGGTITAVPEFAEELHKARGVKPIVAVAQYLAGSAAYWLATQVDALVAAPSSYVGSVGVYWLHVSEAGLLEREGVALTAIHYGRYKVEGNWWEPLGDEARAFEQAQVNENGRWFVRDVARGRGVTPAVVAAKYGEGRAFQAKAALAAGMVDAIGQVETVAAKLARSVSGRGARADVVEPGWAQGVADEVVRELRAEQQEPANDDVPVAEPEPVADTVSLECEAIMAALARE